MEAKAKLVVVMENSEHAELALKALSVDVELSPERSTKILTTEGGHLIANFSAVDARSLRVSMSSYCDMLSVVLRTLREFG